jgi:transglutaminase-like putative cysteine protease
MLMRNLKIPHFNETIQIAQQANVKQIAETMREVALIESKKPYIKALAEKLFISKNEPYYSAFKLCNFAYNAATFEPDQVGRQVLKTPYALLREKKGNCVDYTILISALAIAANIPAIIKVVAVHNSKDFGHVYPIINGLPCDVVPYQRQDGKEHLYRTGSEIVYPTEEKYNKFFLVEI